MSRMGDIMMLIESGEPVEVIADYIMKNNSIIDETRATALAKEFTYKYRRVIK
tara:strand:+ start:291 stop:449 length:159 start_codon:yes stop_codon:yes gene_type:complete